MTYGTWLALIGAFACAGVAWLTLETNPTPASDLTVFVLVGVAVLLFGLAASKLALAWARRGEGVTRLRAVHRALALAWCAWLGVIAAVIMLAYKDDAVIAREGVVGGLSEMVLQIVIAPVTLFFGFVVGFFDRWAPAWLAAGLALGLLLGHVIWRRMWPRRWDTVARAERLATHES